MKTAYIIDGIRTAIGSFRGTLSLMRTDDLAALVLKRLLQRNPNIDPSAIADVILGCTNQAGEDNRNVARMALLLAGLPHSIPGETVNRLCASGLSACMIGAREIMVGDAELIIAGGVESMTRSPWVISKSTTAFATDAQMFDSSFGWRFINKNMQEKYGIDRMGDTAENLNDIHGISRQHQDEFAFLSQQKAASAQQKGRFELEIMPLEIPQYKADPKIFAADEFMKPNTTLEILNQLKPAFRAGGSVTAGNSSGLNDGAAALLFASEDAIKKYNLKPLARIIASAAVGVEPRIMGIGPVPASNLALKKAGLGMQDLDIIELNEAFAIQALACIRSWNLKDDDPRINPNGGAIALGHPLGMTGARILLTAALELQQQNRKLALVTLCVGVGQGYAVIIEKV